MRRTLFLFLVGCGQVGPGVSNNPDAQDAAALTGHCSHVVLANAVVSDTSGDGLLLPGEVAKVTVLLSNQGSEGVDAPYFIFNADRDGVTFEQNSHYFVALPGAKLSFELYAYLSNQLSPGDTIHVSLAVGSQGQACAAQPLDVQLALASACVVETPVSTPGGCDALAHLSVSDFHVEGDVADGNTVTLKASINELNGIADADYPGLVFSSADSGVTFSDEPVLLYALGACESRTLSVSATLPSTLQDSAEVRFFVDLASPATKNSGCPNALGLELTAPVAASR